MMIMKIYTMDFLNKFAIKAIKVAIEAATRKIVDKLKIDQTWL